MMLIQISFVLFLPVVIGTTCDRNFAKIGCFTINPELAKELLITDLDPTHHKWGEDIDWSDFEGSLHSLACRCRDKAIGKYQYFSLGFYGECFGASSAEVFHESRTESQACVNGGHGGCTKDSKGECVGVQDAEYVYEIETAPTAPAPKEVCPIEKGFCVLPNGGDQNSGVIKLNNVDGNTAQAQETCLNLCRQRQDATGCEVIWDQGNRGCYIHTQTVARGNGVDRHMCWIFSKCAGEAKYKNLLSFPEEKELTKNVLLTTIPKLSRTFIVKFQIKPSVFQPGWTSILHMTAHGNNIAKYGDRVPAVWFWSSNPSATVNRLHICSAINGNRNYCYNTPVNIPKGKWTEVEISQVEALEGVYRYEVKVNNVVIGSVANKQAQEFENVKVFTADPWHNNMQGQIRQLSIVPDAGVVKAGGSLTFADERPLTKNTLLTTIPVLSPSYIVKFQINPSKFQPGWSNVIHFTATGGNCCNYGDRIPAVWFHSISPQATANRLHITSAVNNNGNYVVNTQNIVKRGVWTCVEISQRTEGSSYRYTVKVGGKVIHSVINKNPKEFKNVQVYIADNFHNAQPGHIRDIFINPQADL